MEEIIEAFLKVEFSDGNGSGDGDGSGDGYGNGYGYGDGYGNGYGYGDGSGSKLFSTLNGKKVYDIDSVPTIIESLRGNVACGFSINNDLTLTKCYIVRVFNSFAHGSTAKEAFKDARNKHLSTLSDEEKMSMFVEKFSDLTVKYEASIFYEFHNVLTGSCEFGRKAFMSNKGISMSDLFTPLEFLELTKNEYNNSIIKSILTSINK